jgi:hypothetical protein
VNADRITSALERAQLPRYEEGLEKTIVAARAVAAPRPHSRPRRRVALIGASAAVLLVGFALTPPGHAAVDWLGSLVGFGEVGGPPTIHQQFRHTEPAGHEVIIGRGIAPDGSPFEVVEFRGKGEGLCFALDFPETAPKLGNSGVCSRTSSGVELATPGASLPSGTPAHPNIGWTSGLLGPEVSRVRVDFDDGILVHGRRDAQVFFATPGILKTIGARKTTGMYLAFLPRNFSPQYLLRGGSIRVTGFNEAGSVVAQREQHFPQPKGVRSATISIDRALARIAPRAHVPLVLPSKLPASARLMPGTQNGRPASSQLKLSLPGDDTLIIQYGRSGFDGCGPADPQVVHINGQPGILDNYHLDRGSPYPTVIWPATPDHLVGRYGLTGSFSFRRLLGMARSMQAARVPASREASQGC